MIFVAGGKHYTEGVFRTVESLLPRFRIGFDGLLITDDLSMKALTGDFRTRAERAIAAGCDVVLHCNGDLSEARPVAGGAPELSGAALARAARALDCVRSCAPLDEVAARATRDIYQQALTRAGYGAITTEIAPAPTFYYAEADHQQYLAKNPDGYCGLGGAGVACPIG